MTRCKHPHQRFYDGALGYESWVCVGCGTYFDHTGEHAPDEWSLSFLGWRDSEEGPWRTKTAAEEFAEAEVGVEYRVVEIRRWIVMLPGKNMTGIRMHENSNTPESIS